MPIRSFGPAAWQQTQDLFAAGALLAVIAWLLLGPATARGRAELRALGIELQQVGQRAWQAWSQLPVGQRRFFGGQMLLLTAVRLYLSGTVVWLDDATSYHLFVRHGLLAVGAYYPLPNNHELNNLISLGFYQVHPDFWWSMRLPVLLISTAATGLLFRVLLQRLGYWPALLVAMTTSWLQPNLYHAASGRGYWLVLLLTGLIFWAMLALLDLPSLASRGRAEWLILVGAGVLGSYAVPTFAYVLFSAWSWLGWLAIRRRHWVLLGQAVVAGLLIITGAVGLYGPTLYVSGWTSLLANPYLRPQHWYWQQFGIWPHAPSYFSTSENTWSHLPSYLWTTESYLGGQPHLGALLGLFGIVTFAWAAWKASAGCLPTVARQQVLQVGWPALWFTLSAYLLLPTQQVLPPERIWLYKSWFSFMLIAVSLAYWPWTHIRRWVLGGAVMVFALYQLTALLGDNRRKWRQLTKNTVDYEWFAPHFDVVYPAAPIPHRLIKPPVSH
ncbi:MAG: hypothetical protein ACRYFV_17710 [Janthinobacterium lividum]